MADEDAELVALIDNELDEGSRGALLARLATDERLRQRYNELRAAGEPIARSLEELLGQGVHRFCFWVGDLDSASGVSAIVSIEGRDLR